MTVSRNVQSFIFTAPFHGVTSQVEFNSILKVSFCFALGMNNIDSSDCDSDIRNVENGIDFNVT